MNGGGEEDGGVLIEKEGETQRNNDKRERGEV